MPIVPLFGHAALRERLRAAVARGRLPATLLFHGPQGVGKQRLALWLGQLLLCSSATDRPCGQCEHCRFSGLLRHPDLHWYFPRPRLKDADASPRDVADDLGDAIAERVENGNLYAAPAGTEGIYVAQVRAIVRAAAMAPALARRKVFVVGDADRLAQQEGAEVAANAFLKLLEEPLADTTIVLTSSEPSALLPTIRSRVAAVRVAPLPDGDVRAFLANELVQVALSGTTSELTQDEIVRDAGGAPGRLLSSASAQSSIDAAKALLAAAARGDRASSWVATSAQGASRARGGFADMLDALTTMLAADMREAAQIQADARALATARAVDAVERAKVLADANVNPMLVGAKLVRELGEALA